MPPKTPPAAEPLSELVAPAISLCQPGETLETVLKAARIAEPVIEGPDGRAYAFIPKDFTLEPIEDEAALPPRAAQRVIVDDRASLTHYVNRFSDSRSVIIGDFDAGLISARLDWHPHNQMECHGSHGGTDAHSVTLKLRFSEEFARWNAAEGKMIPQAEFARFLEENSGDILHPDAATMIEISRDFEATVGQTYKSTVRLDNGDRKMMFQSETNAQNGVIIPQKFTLNIPIYNGEQPDDLTALFRWRPSGGDGVLLGFQWHRVEYQRRAHFAAIATAAAEDTGRPVFMGRTTYPL